MRELSKMQQKIYEYIAACIRGAGLPPQCRRIREAVGLYPPRSIFTSNGRRRASLKRAPAEHAITRESPKPENQVPVVGNVAAGSPILAEECIED